VNTSNRLKPPLARDDKNSSSGSNVISASKGKYKLDRRDKNIQLSRFLNPMRKKSFISQFA